MLEVIGILVIAVALIVCRTAVVVPIISQISSDYTATY